MKYLRPWIAGLLLLCLAVALGLPAPARADSGHPFADLLGNPAESTVTALFHLGVVSGTAAGKFSPDSTLTRAQMATFIVRAMGKESEANSLKESSTGFADISPTHWARGYISLASQMGIVVGSGGLFKPDDHVNYAQATTMLIRALGYGPQITGGYPTGYVLKANQLGLLQDVNHFNLLNDVSRLDAAQMLYNAIYRVPTAALNLTWSQAVFKQVATLALDALPTYVAPGQQVTLNATANDLAGKPIANTDITYEVVSGSGQVAGNVLTVGTVSGPLQVKAHAGTLEATAATTAVTGLTITPATFKVSKGGTVQLQATAQAGSQAVSVTPTWTVTQGPATVDSNGLLSVTDYGSVTVQATLGSLTASAAGQAVGKVTIGQKPAYLVPGQPVTLTATVTDTAGQPLSVPITWSATGANVDQNGQVTLPTAAQVTVQATAGGISDQVTIPVLQSLQVSPATVNLLSGATQRFTVKGVDSTGKTYDLTPQWSPLPNGLGVMGADGTVAGTGSGSTDVIATVGTLQGRAHLMISGPPATLSLTSANPSLPAGSGATTTITVQLLDSSGNVSAVDDQPITLSLADSTGASLGRTLLLAKQGVASTTLTAGSGTGTIHVQAAVPGTALSSSALAINSYSPVATHLHLSMTPTPLAAGGAQATLTVTLQDANNFPVAASQAISVNLSNNTSALGIVTSNILVIPYGQASASTTFVSSSQAGTAAFSATTSSNYPVDTLQVPISNVGPAAGVKIHPITTATPVNGLSSLRVDVDVVDQSGVVRAGDSSSQVQLAISGPTTGTSVSTLTATTVGGTATFTIPATTVGTVTLTASLPALAGSGSDTATADFVPGVAASLRLSSVPATLAADGVSQSQVIAEVVDKAGNLLTTVNPVVTFRRLGTTAATTAISSLTVQSVGGRAVLTVQASRNTGTDTWYASAPGVDTQNLATITTGVAGSTGSGTGSAGSPYSLFVSSNVTSARVGQNITVTVRVMDNQGNTVTQDAGRVILIQANNANASLSTQQVVTAGGLGTFTVTGITPGVTSTTTLTLIASGLPQQQTTLTLTFTP